MYFLFIGTMFATFLTSINATNQLSFSGGGAFGAVELGILKKIRESYPVKYDRYTGISAGGLNSGFMIPQYTTAALVTENKSLCFPPSADSIPTSLGQEDHVSMGSISGRKFNQILGNLEKILAIELMYSAQALEFRRPNTFSSIIEKNFSIIREPLILCRSRYPPPFVSHTRQLIFYFPAQGRQIMRIAFLIIPSRPIRGISILRFQRDRTLNSTACENIDNLPDIIP